MWILKHWERRWIILRALTLLTLIICFITLLNITTVSSIRIKELKNKEIKNEIVYYKGEEKPYTGKFINGDLEEEYVEGVKNGFFKGSFLDKNVRYTYEGRYIEGIKHGEWIIRYPSGKRKAVLKYNYDRPYSKWVYFYEDNKIEGYENFKNGVLDGEVANFDKNGDKTISATYKNGLLQGKICIFEDSQLKVDTFFHNGKLNGEIKIFSRNGKTLVDGVYKENNREGTWKFFYQSGDIKTAVSYLNGKKNGKTLIYDKGGTLVEKLDFKDGCLIGSKDDSEKRLKDDIVEILKFLIEI